MFLCLLTLWLPTPLLMPSILFLATISTPTLVHAATTAAQAAEVYTNDTVFRSAVLDSTNAYRKQHNATALVWNATLAGFARRAGAGCEFEHSGGPYGENLAAGYPNATSAIAAWAHERNEYDFTKGEFSKQTGHFTQLVWKATTALGCSRTECNGGEGGAPGWYVICEYWPPGNVLGAFGENVQRRVGDGKDEEEEGEEEGDCIQGAVCSAAVRIRGQTWGWKVVGLVVFVTGLVCRLS